MKCEERRKNDDAEPLTNEQMVKFCLTQVNWPLTHLTESELVASVFRCFSELVIITGDFGTQDFTTRTKRDFNVCGERLGDLIKVEEYLTGRSLTLSYWKDLAVRELKTDLGYWLTVQSSQDSSKPLQVPHNPPLSSKDSEMDEQSTRSDQLSLENLLVHTIYMRTRCRLVWS